MDRLATDRPELIITGSFIDDGRVLVGDVGDIGRLINDRDVAFRWQKRLLSPRRTEFATSDETILIGSDIIITVRPIPNSGALIETGFRRQWGPTNIIVALAP